MYLDWYCHLLSDLLSILEQHQQPTSCGNWSETVSRSFLESVSRKRDGQKRVPRCSGGVREDNPLFPGGLGVGVRWEVLGIVGCFPSGEDARGGHIQFVRGFVFPTHPPSHRTTTSFLFVPPVRQTKTLTKQNNQKISRQQLWESLGEVWVGPGGVQEGSRGVQERSGEV